MFLYIGLYVICAIITLWLIARFDDSFEFKSIKKDLAPMVFAIALWPITVFTYMMFAVYDHASSLKYKNKEIKSLSSKETIETLERDLQEAEDKISELLANKSNKPYR